MTWRRGFRRLFVLVAIGMAVLAGAISRQTAVSDHPMKIEYVLHQAGWPPLGFVTDEKTKDDPRIVSFEGLNYEFPGRFTDEMIAAFLDDTNWFRSLVSDPKFKGLSQEQSLHVIDRFWKETPRFSTHRRDEKIRQATRESVAQAEEKARERIRGTPLSTGNGIAVPLAWAAGAFAATFGLLELVATVFVWLFRGFSGK